MRSPHRTDDPPDRTSDGFVRLSHLPRGVLRDIALVWLADAVVGVSFGAIAVAGGLPVWVPVLMSLLVYAGSAQFSAVGILAAGGGCRCGDRGGRRSVAARRGAGTARPPRT
ncbi:AzlC family ABC transporter permease, partial [Streptomyces sp. NPDC055214]